MRSGSREYRPWFLCLMDSATAKAPVFVALLAAPLIVQAMECKDMICEFDCKDNAPPIIGGYDLCLEGERTCKRNLGVIKNYVIDTNPTYLTHLAAARKAREEGAFKDRDSCQAYYGVFRKKVEVAYGALYARMGSAYSCFICDDAMDDSAQAHTGSSVAMLNLLKEEHRKTCDHYSAQVRDTLTAKWNEHLSERYAQTILDDLNIVLHKLDWVRRQGIVDCPAIPLPAWKPTPAAAVSPLPEPPLRSPTVSYVDCWSRCPHGSYCQYFGIVERPEKERKDCEERAEACFRDCRARFPQTNQ